MFYFLDSEMSGVTQRFIVTPLSDGGVTLFPLTDDNPNKPAYDAWVAEGNTAEEWSPDATI